MLAFFTSALSFMTLLLNEFFSADAQAKAEGRQFKIDQKSFQDAVNNALKKQLASMAQVSQNAGNAWDAADSEANNTGDKK